MAKKLIFEVDYKGINSGKYFVTIHGSPEKDKTLTINYDLASKLNLDELYEVLRAYYDNFDNTTQNFENTDGGTGLLTSYEDNAPIEKWALKGVWCKSINFGDCCGEGDIISINWQFNEAVREEI